MTVVDVLLLILLSAVFTFSAYLVVHVLPCEITSPLWVRLAVWGIYAVLGTILPNLFLNDIITMIVISIYYLVIGSVLYHKSKTGLLYQLIYCMAMYASQVIGIIIGLMLFRKTSLEQNMIVYMMEILKQLLTLFIAVIIAAVIRRRYAQDYKKLKIRGMVVVPVFSIVLLFLYMTAGDVFFMRYGYGWIILFSLLLIIINVYCLYFWYDVAANQELKHRLELMQQQSGLTHQYYEEMERNYNESRKIIHDIRNHLHILEESGKMDTKDYFRDLHGMLNSLGLKFYSENKMLNIVLNDKLKNIPSDKLECSLGEIRLDFMADVDITTIFANLLDNAAEAAENQPEFWLKIRGEQIQDFTVIKICNSYTGNYQPGKSEKEGHEGIGLQNVKSAVEKYQGELKIECREHEFSITMFFPGE